MKDKTTSYKIAFYSFIGIAIIIFYLMIKNNPISILLMLLIDAAIITTAIIILIRKFWNKGTGTWKKTTAG